MSPAPFPCPECRAVLKLANEPPPGKKIRCPKCQAVFAVPGEEDDIPTARPRERPAGAVRKTRPPDDASRVAARPARRAAPVRDNEDDEDEDFGPRPRRRRTKARGGSGLLIGLVAGGLVLALLGAGAVGAWVWPGFLKDKAEGASASDKDKGKDGSGDGGTFTDCKDALAYVPKDSVRVMGLDVAALRNESPVADNLEYLATTLGSPPLNFGSILAVLKKESGKPFQDWCDYVVLSYLPAGPQSPFPGQKVAVLKLREPMDVEKVIPVFRSPSKKEVQGKTYYAAQFPVGEFTALAMPSGRLMVLANNKDHMEAVLAAGAGGPALEGAARDMLERVGKNHVWRVEDARAQLELSRQFAKNAVPGDPFGELSKATVQANPQVTGFGMRFTGSQVLFHDAIACANASATQQVVTATKKFLEHPSGALLIAQSVRQLPHGPFNPSATIQAMVKEMRETYMVSAEGKLVLGNFQISRQTYDATMKRPAGGPAPIPDRSTRPARP